MVTMVTKRLINLTFYGTFKYDPIPYKNCTFLSQGSYEIKGGSARPPLGIRCGSKTLCIRRIKVIQFSTQMNSQNSTWKMTTQIKLDMTKKLIGRFQFCKKVSYSA